MQCIFFLALFFGFMSSQFFPIYRTSNTYTHTKIAVATVAISYGMLAGCFRPFFAVFEAFSHTQNTWRVECLRFRCSWSPTELQTQATRMSSSNLLNFIWPGPWITVSSYISVNVSFRSPQLYSYTINIGRRKSVNWMNNSIRQQLLGLYESMIFFWIPYEP